MVGLLPYCVIGILAIVFRVHDLDDSGRCLIGVERQTSILVIVYDLVINVRAPSELLAHGTARAGREITADGGRYI
jgi:hypothetical protein